MLGWDVMVFRREARSSGRPEELLLARWTTGVFGLQWLDDLVKAEKATDLGGNGYPNRYTVAVSVLLPILSGGLPPNHSPLVIGDDYVLPQGWNGELQVGLSAFSDCPSDEKLVIEAWDQS